MNLPSTGHYGIPDGKTSEAAERFELAINGALWYMSMALMARDAASFELALNGALWYKNAGPIAYCRCVLNLPSTGHYGIRKLKALCPESSFELALNGALWYSGAGFDGAVAGVLNLPSTGHYGIHGDRVSPAPDRF